ncbi:autotransporter-associated beta strand repeat-containing protein [Saccharicrinis sp. FJH54]|uniref:rhamnogalacturonan lyase family protein n=1 Tax=Saccharicrinis sp. FJH54 TaxID=3344665 RepID=UPI0035D4E586
MKTKLIFKYSAFIFLFLTAITLQAQRKMEALDRGVVAVKKGNGVYLSWRIAANELRNVGFNIYKDGVKVTDEPIYESSNYTDVNGTSDTHYAVAAVVDQTEQEKSDEVSVWGGQYLEIPVVAINGRWDTYTINDASVGDLDGDGQYEVVVKRLPVNTDPSATDYNLLEAYKLDGTLLWRINLGPNIANAVETNFLVYDFDGDGKAEIATRTSDGMIDGTGVNIGDRDNDGIVNYRYSLKLNSTYYRIAGPDYISIFEGETGKELGWDIYIERDPLVQWGNPGMNDGQLAHRATKCMWTVAYLDGKHPSMVNSRGIYHRIKLEAWDWNGINLTKRWAWDSNPGGTATVYTGQGNHQLSCADVDDDGCDEIIYGSMTVDNDGTGLYSARTGHGDALHVGDMDPDRPGLEIWDCLENSSDWGATFRDARTGEILIRYHSNRDCGRCAAGDINPDYKGYELWAATECPMYDPAGHVVGSNNVPQNFMIWWDGDLSREFLTDANFSSDLGYGIPDISKYNTETKDNYSIFRANGTATNNWTKGTPCLQADVIGDWREEIVVRTPDNNAMRIYTTTMPTDQRIPTLMHEPQYRIAISWQNNAYNQPPHPGIYLGTETQDIPPYPFSNGELVWKNGPDWNTTSSNWLDEDENPMNYTDGADVLFDYNGDNASPVNVAQTLKPHSLRVQSQNDYTFEGAGQLSGHMELLKAGTGTLTLSNTSNNYSGETMVYYGTLQLKSNLDSSHVTVCRFGTLYAGDTLGNGLWVKTDASFSPGSEAGEAVRIAINNNLTLQDGAKVYFDLSGDPNAGTGSNDQIVVSGNVSAVGTCRLIFNRLDGVLNPGSYELITFSGSFNGSAENFSIEGIPDVACELKIVNQSLVLNVLEVRTSTKLVWNGNSSNVWDFAGDKNWLNGDQQDWFLGNDTVIFNETGENQNNVNITEDVPVSGILVDGASNYSFSGSGKISGMGGLVKNGAGKLFLKLLNTYEGPTVLNGGMTEVAQLADAGKESPLGAASTDAANLVINGAILRINGLNSTTDRGMTFGPNNGTLYIDALTQLEMTGAMTGEGALIKDGDGTLSLYNGNTYSGGTVINNGLLKLASETAAIEGLGSGLVTLKNATLQMFNNTGSDTKMYWNLDVPAGFNATLNLDGRCAWYGNLTGSGALEIYTPYIRSDLMGDWSGFTGDINVSTDNDGGWLILGNTAGYGQSTIHLEDKVTALYANTEDAVIEIGELTGISGSVLGSGGQGSNTITWKIGGKNTSFTFDGRINNDQYKNSGSQAAVIKAGSGRWTLTGNNTYTGGTVIEKGAILVENNSGSATGAGPVDVNGGGLLGGSGTVSGDVTVKANGYISPGNASGIGSMNLGGDLTVESGGYIFAKVDAANNTADIAAVSGSVNLNGAKIYLNRINGTYAAGNHFKVLQASEIIGSVDGVIPSSPGEGLYWDLSLINTGIVKVTNTVAINETKTDPVVVYPNPSKGMVAVDLSGYTKNGYLTVETLTGKVIYATSVNGGTSHTLDLRHADKGIYLLKIQFGDEKLVNNLIIN